MKVTIKEIATDAGVSVSTVSRVISNNPKISESTKEKVRESIERLNYKPNIMARGLVKKRTGILGVIMPKEAITLFSSPFFIEVMQGISLKGKERDYYIMYDFCKNEKEEYEGTKKLVESGLVDGICLMSTRKGDKSIKYLKELQFPFVIVGEPEEKDEVLWVDNNNLKATYDMVKKVISKGENSAVFIGGDKNLTVTTNRVEGFKKACKELNIQSVVHLGKDFSREEGFRLAEIIFAKENYKNFIVSDDNLLKGFLEYVEKFNIKNINIGSFNRTNLKRIWKNKVFLLDIKPEKLGIEAVNLLIDNILGDSKFTNKVIDIELN
ncbi:LacI family DNA-binding transcriptional regulator [Candidatus Cetobacterium colombiensis]|jgi:LacI family transcriptional regulator|uniref:LacI family DNA-binding transcriptional regulator n=1 Tax=Candidatus Cetobacterium colombiensis TaxID=3073100 RepID=A0ABU4WC02_9FUSO|nr:LacI family DNA-binding transcriptional regulator [Candidatus Cetobacterium colombiensis]MDX8336023.1 LacI family DNA-binding transcriptional regulator [Candidatus Cetobacterium colombiensis]